MNATYEGQQTQFRLVSPLYGQGTTACWYLTMLSCIISWSLHPKRSRSDSIDLNLLTILTFPTVASVHLIVQARSFQQKTANSNGTETMQVLRGIEASLTVPEAFFLIHSVSIRLASAMRCSKRAFLLFLVGCLCLAAEVVLYASVPQASMEPGNLSFQRRHLSNCSSLLQIVLIQAILESFLLGGIYGLFLASCFQKTRLNNHESEALGHRRRPLLGQLGELVGYQIEDSSYKRWMTLAGIPGAFFGVVVSAVPFVIQSRHESDLGVSSFFDLVYSNALPSDGDGIHELDQAVALAGGVIVLVITLFSTVNARYCNWKAARAESNSQQQVEAVRLGDMQPRGVSEDA